MECLFGGAHKGGSTAEVAKEDTIDYLFPYGSRYGSYGPPTLLHKACMQGDVKQVRRLLTNEEVTLDDIQSKESGRKSPMYYAVESNSTEVVRLLLQKFPNFFKVDDYKERIYNSMILQLAIENLNVDVMELLLKGGCPVNITTKANAMDTDWTPLQFTCYCVFRNKKESRKSTRNHPVLKVVKKLLEYKADPTAKDDLNRTALHILLTVHSQTDIHDDVASLLLYNCSLTKYEGRTLLLQALEKGRMKIVQKLMKEQLVSVFEVSFGSFTLTRLKGWWKFL